MSSAIYFETISTIQMNSFLRANLSNWLHLVKEFMAASIISVVEMTKNTDSKYKGTYVMNPDHFTHAISQLELLREEVTEKKTAAKNRQRKRKLANETEKNEGEEANNKYTTTSGDRAKRMNKRRKRG